MRLIDADALDNIVSQLNKEGRAITRNEYKILNSIIFEFPTIEAEPIRRARWKEHPYDREWDVCSYCKLGTKRREFGMTAEGREWVTEQSYTYCPWCGAKMKGRE